MGIFCTIDVVATTAAAFMRLEKNLWMSKHFKFISSPFSCKKCVLEYGFCPVVLSNPDMYFKLFFKNKRFMLIKHFIFWSIANLFFMKSEPQFITGKIRTLVCTQIGSINIKYNNYQLIFVTYLKFSFTMKYL